MSGGAGVVALGNDRLNPVGELLVDYGRALALVALAVPQEIAAVEGVL